MKKILSNRIVALVLGGLVIGLSIFAFQASASSTTPNTVTICVKNSGFVYVVGQGFWTKDCGKRDKLIAINTEGVPGPKGDKGDKGDSCDLSQVTQSITSLQQQVQELSNRLSCLSKVGNDLYFDNCNITVRNGTIQTVSTVVNPPVEPTEQPSLIIAKNPAYSDLNVAPNTTYQKIGSFVLTASSSEAIRVVDINFGFLSGHEQIQNLKLSYNGIQSTAHSTASASNNHFTTEINIQPHASVMVDIYADIGNGASGTVQSAISSLSAMGVLSGNTTPVISEDDMAGQIITIVNP